MDILNTVEFEQNKFRELSDDMFTGSMYEVRFFSSTRSGLVGDAIRQVGKVDLKPLAVKSCLTKYSLLERISASILSEYLKDSTPDKGLQEDLAGEFILEYEGVNRVFLPIFKDYCIQGVKL